MRFLLFLTLCLLGPLLRAEFELSGRMPEDLMPGLRRVIDSALRNSDPMMQSERLMEEADGRRVSARSAVLPSLRTSAAFRQEDDRERDEQGFEERVIFSVTLSQPLYHWGVRKKERDIGKLQHEIESLNTSRTASQVIKKVRSDYMGLVVAKQELERSAVELELDRAELDFQQRQIEAGAASRSSINRFEIARDRSELARVRALMEWERRLEELSIYAGLEAEALEALVAEEIPEVEVLSPEELEWFELHFVEGVEQDEMVRRRDKDIEIERKRLDIVRMSLRPKIDAQVGITSNARDLDGVRREQEFAFFGFSVGWNIFDGFQTKGRAREALSRLSRVERSKEILEDSLMRSYRQRQRQLEIGARALAIDERLAQGVWGQVVQVRKAVEEERMAASQIDRYERDFHQASIRAQRSRISYLETLSELASELGLDPAEQRLENEGALLETQL